MAIGFCQCESCRQWSETPVTAFSLRKLGSVTITKAEDPVGAYRKTPKATRKWCKECGVHVLTDNPEKRSTDYIPALVAGLGIKPAMHVHYQESVLRIRDRLPK